MISHRKLIYSTLLLSLLNVGCIPQRDWVKPNTSSDQKQRDILECNYDAAKTTPIYDGRSNPIVSGIAAGTRESELRTMCMEAKGYHLEIIKNSIEVVKNSNNSSLKMTCQTNEDCSDGLHCRSISGGGSVCK